MRRRLAILATLVCTGLIAGCGAGKGKSASTGSATQKAENNHAGHDHDTKGKHGGAIIPVGKEAAHIEFVHDPKAGKAVLYITGKDAEIPLAIGDAPELKLETDQGPKVIKTEAVDPKDGKSAQFTAVDDLLKTDPLKGRVALKIDGKPYSPAIKGAHAHHDHGSHEDHSGHSHDAHKGHDHDKDGHASDEHEGHDHGHSHNHGGHDH